ncbi:hypothetical protein [Streptosporangium lutulentum]|uniref:Uncharacterized protein n=1 Tax=Streptosporangium lutulentum TaxID=1461250 RepID=A0ABT9QLD3_9ACTN|nr:hypothetical protein [Streptosporangium lutulentum]MDP9847577.1 hypothetical protein [Streptosporangium lutulentum]
MIAFIRGIRIPVSTLWMPASARISSMSAGNLGARAASARRHEHDAVSSDRDASA